MVRILQEIFLQIWSNMTGEVFQTYRVSKPNNAVANIVLKAPRRLSCRGGKTLKKFSRSHAISLSKDQPP